MSHDILTLATQIVTQLAPYTPQLIRVAQFSGNALAEMAVQNSAQALWNKLWGKLNARFGQDRAVTGAATMLSAEPDNQEFQQALIKILANRLQQNPDLVAELWQLLGDQDSVQKVAADQGSLIEDVEQEIVGPGTQVVQAGNDSAISGVKQRKM